jgi:hypothetical protein
MNVICILEVSHAKPIFTEAPKNLTVMKSTNALLWVDILSEAEYIVQWKKHSSEHPEKLITVQVYFDYLQVYQRLLCTV